MMPRVHVSGSARWSIAALIVIVAMIVAIWPRATETASEPVDPGVNPSAPLPGINAQVSEQDMAQARERAALQPCPVGDGTPPAPGSALTGIVLSCLADGATVDLGSATAGRPLLINIWAHWCGPCRTELPVVADFAARAGDRMRVLTVQGREGSQNPLLSLNLLIETGVNLPTVVDTDARLAAALSVPRVYPCTVLVRADGTVAAVLPQVFETADELADVVGQHLGLEL
ncbi:thiol-disulfide isomerase/thioredoxin [Williamsia muralis]|nr:thiol-disulfide isomerase/thioredoxin [Williamsia marianensis]PZT92090.1 MAG: alkyl hydroperoxide reductase [Gordonia sp. (in: high G+C Gram-positive bacteria)]